MVTPSKLYTASVKLGTQLNSEAMSAFRAKPPSFLGFDGKIMNVKSYLVDERGVKHQVQNKRDQIGGTYFNIGLMSQNVHIILSPGLSIVHVICLFISESVKFF